MQTTKWLCFFNSDKGYETESIRFHLGSLNLENRPETWFTPFPNPNHKTSVSFSLLHSAFGILQNTPALWARPRLSIGRHSVYMSVDYHLTWRPTNGSTCRPTLNPMLDEMSIDCVLWWGIGWYFGILVNIQSIRRVSSVSIIFVDCQWHISRLS